MKKFLFLMIIVLFHSMGPTIADSSGMDIEPDNAMYLSLEQIITNISDGLQSLDTINEESANKLSVTGISGNEATLVLKEKISRAPYSQSSLIITPEGKVSAAAPDIHSGLIGEDLSYQSQVQFANNEKKPVMSDVFLLKEGFFGISLSYPVFSDTQEYLGYTDITFRPEEYLRQFIIPVTSQKPYDVMVMQTDGMIIYETNDDEIGRNALTDALYESSDLRKTAQLITLEKSGSTTYQFWNKNWNQIVERLAIWDTIVHDMREWRVVIISDIPNDAESDEIEEITQKRTQAQRDSLQTSITDLDEFISSAAIYAENYGKDEAIIAFNNLSGPFVEDEKYIFAYDMDGTALALPYQKGLIGTNRMNITDVNGFAILPGMIDVARKDGGYLYFVYQNPSDNFSPQLKLFRIMPGKGDWFMGSGIFLPNVTPFISEKDHASLIQRVRDAVMHADDVGKEQAIIDFNDISGPFASGKDYIFAYDYDGTTRALPFQPDIIGSNRYDFSDTYGSNVTRMEIDTAKRGGGYVYVVYYNPETKIDELKLCYVLPAGDDWLVGSGVYTGESLTV